MMGVKWRKALLIGALAASLSCSLEREEAVPPIREIPQGAFAVVGAHALELSLLEEFDAKVRRQAARDVVRDQLLRTEAERVGPARARVVYRGELARRLVERVESEVRQSSAVTETEAKEEYARRWLEFDRPRALRTVQVFFPVAPPHDDDAQYQRAQRLRTAVEGTHNLEQFSERSKAVLKGATGHRVFEMPPLSRDGRIVPVSAKDHNVAGISSHLAEAVSELSHAGDISRVVGTEDGYHVFLVTEVIPERVVPFEETRPELERAIYGRRVEQALDAISKSPAVEVDRRRTDLANLLTLVRKAQ